MTSAGGGGGPGFTSGDDYVAARLSIDIPEDGVQGVRELRDEVERFRVTMEAAARSEADHSRYLDQMTQASKQAAEAQANLTEQVQNYLNVQSQLTGSASGASGGGMTQPWSGVSAGMGASGQAGAGSRPASPTDISYQVNPVGLGAAGAGGAQAATQLASSNPREYLNMQAPRGNINPTDAVNISPQSIAALADRIAQRENDTQKQAKMTGDDPPVKHPPAHTPPAQDPYAHLSSNIQGGIGLAGQVMNEVGPGGSHAGLAGLAMTGLNYAQNKLQDRQAKKASAPATPRSGKGQDDTTAAADGSGGEGGDDSASEATGGASKLLKSIPLIGGLLTSVAGIFGLAQSGGQMVQGMRDMGGVRGGAAGEGFTLGMHQRGLAMDPMISGGQSRQVYQALTSEGYSDASGEGADDVKGFMTNNIKNFGMGVPESVQLLRMAAKGTKVSLEELTDSLSKLREQSKTGYIGQGDLQKMYFERAGQLQAQGVNQGDALASAAKSTQVFSGDAQLAGTFSPVANDNMSVMERMHGGSGGGALNLPKGLLPGAAQRALAHQGPEAQAAAKLNVYKYWANYFHNAWHDDGDKNGVGYLNATSQFFQYLQKQEPESDYGQNEDSAIALYDEVVENSTADILSAGGGDAVNRQSARSAAPSASARAAGAVPKGSVARQGALAFSSNSGSGQDRGPAEDQPQAVDQQRSSPSSPAIQQQIQTLPVTGSVTISLTPEAQRLLTVAGPQQAQLTPIQRAANAGQGGASVNSAGVGG